MLTHLTSDTKKTTARVPGKAVAVGLLLSVTLLSACTTTTRTLNPEVETHYDATYGFSDKKKIVDELTESLLTSPAVPTETEKPIIIVYGIDNETSEHINTGGITDDIRLQLIQSGEYRFINRKQRNNIGAEADYQYAGFVAPEQRVNEGRQLGADYILSGTLRSIEKQEHQRLRLRTLNLIYYSMNLELTNLETGEISWADNVEIAREATRPVFSF